MAERFCLLQLFKELGIDPSITQIGPDGFQPVSNDMYNGLQPPKTPVPGGRKFSNDPNACKGIGRGGQGNGTRSDN